MEKPLPHYSKPRAGRGGPYVIAVMPESVLDYWQRDSRAHNYVLLVNSFLPHLLLLLPHSVFSYCRPGPGSGILSCNNSLPLKGKQKQANPTGQWTSFVLSVPLFFGHLHPARSNQRTYIPCLFPAHIQTITDKYIFTTAAFLIISIPITQ